MLDDDAGGAVVGGKLGHQFKRRVGVVDVVVGQFLALPLAGGGHPRTRRAVGVERRPLMRVFAITQTLRQPPREHPAARRCILERPGHPARHCRIIGGGPAKGGQRQFLAERQPRRPVVPRQFGQQRRIILGVGHAGDEAVVLGRRPDHRRSADVNVLDAISVRCAARHRRLERIEVHDSQIDRVDAMRGHRQQMLVIVAQRQKPAMHHRVQRLDPTVHHLGETRHLGHIAHRQRGHAQRLGRAPGRDQFHPAQRQRPCKVDQPGLVGHRNQGATDGNEVGHGRDLKQGDHAGAVVSPRSRSRIASGVSCAFAKVQPMRASRPIRVPQITICCAERGLSRPFSR